MFFILYKETRFSRRNHSFWHPFWPFKINCQTNGRDQQDRTPRYYSIASSPLEVTNGFHLTVKTHAKGLCSPCLNHLLRPGDELEFIHLP